VGQGLAPGRFGHPCLPVPLFPRPFGCGHNATSSHRIHKPSPDPRAGGPYDKWFSPLARTLPPWRGPSQDRIGTTRSLMHFAWSNPGAGRYSRSAKPLTTDRIGHRGREACEKGFGKSNVEHSSSKQGAPEPIMMGQARRKPRCAPTCGASPAGSRPPLRGSTPHPAEPHSPFGQALHRPWPDPLAAPRSAVLSDARRGIAQRGWRGGPASRASGSGQHP
jgi:hypothetical protein